MPKYKVTVQRTFQKEVEVEAETTSEAITAALHAVKFEGEEPPKPADDEWSPMWDVAVRKEELK